MKKEIFMKQLFAKILCMLFAMTTGHAFAQIADPTTYTHDFASDGIYYFIIDKDNNRVAVVDDGYFYNDTEAYFMCDTPEYYSSLRNFGDKGYTGCYKWNIDIPSTVEHDGKTYTVTRIHYAAFAGCDDLLSVKLPSTIDDIWDGAFFNCPKLKTVAMTDVSCKMGAELFGMCPSLETLDLSLHDHLSSIYFSSHFYSEVHCTSLREITLPTVFDNWCRLDDMPKDEATGVPVLKALKTKNPKPQTIETFHFDDYIYAHTTLYVPKGSADVYRSHYQWGKFANIAEDGSAGTMAIEVSDEVPVRIAGHSVTACADIKVYDMSGRLCASLDKGMSATLTAGIYVITTENGSAYKVSIP